MWASRKGLGGEAAVAAPTDAVHCGRMQDIEPAGDLVGKASSAEAPLCNGRLRDKEMPGLQMQPR